MAGQSLLGLVADEHESPMDEGEQEPTDVVNESDEAERLVLDEDDKAVVEDWLPQNSSMVVSASIHRSLVVGSSVLAMTTVEGPTELLVTKGVGDGIDHVTLVTDNIHVPADIVRGDQHDGGRLVEVVVSIGVVLATVVVGVALVDTVLVVKSLVRELTTVNEVDEMTVWIQLVSSEEVLVPG